MIRDSLQKSVILALLLAAALAVLFMQPPIPQPQSYHDFADKRAWILIPNAMDVLSNLPFLIFSLCALLITARVKMQNRQERTSWYLFFATTLMVTLGSGYYHWSPNHWGLMWDRLPIVIAFMMFFGLMLAERISWKLGFTLIPLLIVVGIASVLHWYYTETQGAGDMRLYIIMQLYPMLALVVMFSLFSSRYTGTGWLWCILLAYAVAKILEFYDAEFFSLTQNLISGHSAKHIAAATGIWFAAEYLKRRKYKSS